ncbi:hypothetical protein AAT19DRAFT_15523 [Rhodotorula toruloides]|uniref:Uncharacterized protein n=1 Tax=Rhodotorula toruloides TaxID=5286 RepID=A0A2T0A7S0_RHOTO|nr:hypothetical protein AAT19DRAFT_15523 [Rhodotorula toruloides]
MPPRCSAGDGTRSDSVRRGADRESDCAAMDDDEGAPVAMLLKPACRGELCCMASLHAVLAVRVLSASLDEGREKSTGPQRRNAALGGWRCCCVRKQWSSPAVLAEHQDQRASRDDVRKKGALTEDDDDGEKIRGRFPRLHKSVQATPEAIRIANNASRYRSK